jgi:hypothetical protein
MLCFQVDDESDCSSKVHSKRGRLDPLSSHMLDGSGGADAVPMGKRRKVPTTKK